MSGRLFDVPFQNYETAPLRRRENDSFASPSRHFTMQDAADFSMLRRRKRDDQWIVKMAMRAVLLSPVIVLVIWSIASVAFAHRQIQNNNNYSNNYQRMQQQQQQQMQTSRRQWLLPRRMYQPNLGSPLIVQPKNFPNQRMTNEYYNNNNNNIEPPNVIPVLPAGQFYGNEQPQIPVPLNPQQQQFPEQGAQYYYEFPQEQARQQRGMSPQEFPEQQAQYYYEFPEQQQEGPRSATVDLPEQQAKQYYHEFPQESLADGPPLPDSPLQAGQPAMGRAQRHSNLRPNNLVPKNNKVLYYYYNPKDTGRDKNGNLFLPSVVYDANGRPIELQSLNANQVLLEPPSSMIHHNISANATILNITYHHPDTFDGRVYDNKRGMAMPDWGQSTKTDSSIILCTVGVMALLVGAVSARNMRSRSFLSVCIENESLEDDAAYDTAYTVTNNHYNTFAQGWKGDLEKFDV